jgi:hypothetical protein
MSVKKAKTVICSLSNRPVKEAFYDAGYGFSTIKDLRATYGDKTVANDWAVLTLGEFKTRYALV